MEPSMETTPSLLAKALVIELPGILRISSSYITCEDFVLSGLKTGSTQTISTVVIISEPQFNLKSAKNVSPLLTLIFDLTLLTGHVVINVASTSKSNVPAATPKI